MADPSNLSGAKTQYQFADRYYFQTPSFTSKLSKVLY